MVILLTSFCFLFENLSAGTGGAIGLLFFMCYALQICYLILRQVFILNPRCPRLCLWLTKYSYFTSLSISDNILHTLCSCNLALSEMCPNRKFFLVRIFPHSEWIRRDTSYLSVFSPNAGKYGPEKTPYLDTFHAVWIYCNVF